MMIRTIGDLYDAVENIRELKAQVTKQEEFLEHHGASCSPERLKAEQRDLLDRYASLRGAREEPIE